MRLLTTTLLFPDNPIFQVYLLAEHRRHQILPGLVRDGDIGFQGIVVFVTSEGHHNLGRHSLFKCVDDEGSSCCVCPSLKNGGTINGRFHRTNTKRASRFDINRNRRTTLYHCANPIESITGISPLSRGIVLFPSALFSPADTLPEIFSFLIGRLDKLPRSGQSPQLPGRWSLQASPFSAHTPKQ